MTAAPVLDLQSPPSAAPWQRRVVIGDAVLYLGDSLEMLRAGVFDRVGGIVSDPPYGIGFLHSGEGGGGGTLQGAPRMAKTNQRNLGPIHGDDQPFDPRPWIEAAPKAEHGNSEQRRILLWGADHYMQLLPVGGALLAWDKHLGRGADDSFADCEWAWVGRKVRREVFRWLWKGVVSEKTPDDMPPSRIKGGNYVGAASFARIHVSQKPVELMRWCIDKVRPLDGLPVLDPYMGSGSTAVAALTMGLPFVGVEIDHRHFEVACARVTKWVDDNTGAGLPLFREAI